MIEVAALFVASGGVYYGLNYVDPWDENRDARKYKGPWPVIAHPPCQRWGKLWMGNPSYVARTGVRKLKGDDDGMFASALFNVRRWGGVLEHPWGSHAWRQFGISIPPRSGGWVAADNYGSGWTCCVEQGKYGHYARKPTLLFVCGYVGQMPELRWGVSPARVPLRAIEKYGSKVRRMGELAFKGGGVDSRARNGTPIEFRNLLLGIAKRCKAA